MITMKTQEIVSDFSTFLLTIDQQLMIIIRYSCRRRQMETFSVSLAICEGNLPVTSWFPSQRPVTWSFDIFFDVRVNMALIVTSLWYL